MILTYADMSYKAEYIFTTHKRYKTDSKTSEWQTKISVLK